MKKASYLFKVYENPDGTIVSTVSRKVIEKDGMFFKDIDGTGEVTAVNDHRLSSEERAKAYVKTLSVDEKLAQLYISDWRMAKYPAVGPMAPKVDPQPDESGTLDEGEFHGKTIFGDQYLPGTSKLLKEWFNRHLILRANPTPTDMTDWINQLNAVAEECDHYIPVEVASNSRNENGEVVFGMNDAAGVFATWPGTLGIAAAVRGAGYETLDAFADCIKREWDACGMKKGYMYMADVMSDPRWQRTFGTFGEDPELICEILKHIIPRIQGSDKGVTKDGVAMTVKHFPGGGARENGFDPHYAAGQWNVYATEGSLSKYHLPAFQVSVDLGVSSIMPYYSKPSAEKSVVQKDPQGKDIPFAPYGFAYNRYFIDTMLRNEMGFKGYINSDTGIVHNMSWGVEALDIPERIGFAVTQSGVDVISGLFDNEMGKEAYARGKNDYYETHPVPEGFRKEDLVLTDESVDRAVTRSLTEMFELGLFDNPYRNPEEAEKVVATKSDWEAAAQAHRESVVLLKNSGNVLPLQEDKTFYVRAFAKNAEAAAKNTEALKGTLNGIKLTDNPEEADYAVLFVSPSSGAYFNATPGYLELEICENKTVHNVDENNCPLPETHEETTLADEHEIAEIAKAVRANGGKVITNVNFPLAWILGDVEENADVLTAGFDTKAEAVMDVLFGRYHPTGKLPITLPKNDAVLAVNENGVCISRNDVPGYDKDLYMPDELKDENGKAYAYRDTEGNYYELDFGLTY